MPKYTVFMYQFQLSKIGRAIESDKNWNAAIALCIALVGIASASILIAIAEREIGANAITCDHLLIAAITFRLWNGFDPIDMSSGVQPVYTRRAIGLLIIAGISFAISLALWAWSLTQTSIANSTLLNNMMPIFTTLGSWLIFHQRFSLKFVVGMTVAIAGAVIIGIADLQVTESGLTGDLAALIAAFFSAISILSLEQLRIHFATPVIMQWTSLAGGLFILPVAWFTEGRLLPNSLTCWLAIICLGLISQAVGQGLLTYSLANFAAGFVATSMLAIPVIAAIFAMLLFSEHLSILNWLAFAIVLLGIYLALSAKTNQEKLA